MHIALAQCPGSRSLGAGKTAKWPVSKCFAGPYSEQGWNCCKKQ